MGSTFSNSELLDASCQSLQPEPELEPESGSQSQQPEAWSRCLGAEARAWEPEPWSLETVPGSQRQSLGVAGSQSQLPEAKVWSQIPGPE